MIMVMDLNTLIIKQNSQLIQITKEELENKYNVHFTKEPYKINQNTYYLGEITRKYPITLTKWVLENGQNDDVIDDSGMVINTENGIIVIAGCSHSGSVNNLRSFYITNTYNITRN